jgi:hypothetical protein
MRAKFVSRCRKWVSTKNLILIYRFDPKEGGERGGIENFNNAPCDNRSIA